MKNKKIFLTLFILSMLSYTNTDKVIFGSNANSTGKNTVTLGTNAITSENSSIAIGNASKNEGFSNITIGYNANSGNYASIAIGKDSKSEAHYSISLGEQATSKNFSGVSIGRLAKSEGDYSLSIGDTSFSKGTSSIALGSNTKATKDYNIAIGSHSESTGNRSISFGTLSKSRGLWSLALGVESKSEGDRSIAIGNAVAEKNGSISIGRLSSAKIEDSVALGTASLAEIDANVIGHRIDFEDLNTDEKLLEKLGKTEEYNSLKNDYEAKKAVYESDKQRYDVAQKNHRQNDPESKRVFDEAKNRLKISEDNYRKTLKNYRLLTSTYKSTYAAVSIGNAKIGVTRQLVGLAAGKEDTDAVNVAQLKAVENKLKELKNEVSSLGNNKNNIERGNITSTTLEINNGENRVLGTEELTVNLKNEDKLKINGALSKTEAESIYLKKDLESETKTALINKLSENANVENPRNALVTDTILKQAISNITSNNGSLDNIEKSDVVSTTLNIVNGENKVFGGGNLEINLKNEDKAKLDGIGVGEINSNETRTVSGKTVFDYLKNRGNITSNTLNITNGESRLFGTENLVIDLKEEYKNKLNAMGKGEITENEERTVSGKTIYNYLKNKTLSNEGVKEYIDESSSYIANAVAMANLPVNFGDGKHSHSVSASYGNSGSNHAFAFGLSGQGYNVIYKASAAINTKAKFSIGAGIGYMFYKQNQDFDYEKESMREEIKELKKEIEEIKKMLSK